MGTTRIILLVCLLATLKVYCKHILCDDSDDWPLSANARVIALIVYELMKAIIVEGDEEWLLMMEVVVDVLVDSVEVDEGNSW